MESVIAIIGSVVILLIAFLQGKDAGKNKAENENNEEVLGNVSEAKKVADDVSDMQPDDRREQLRKYTKK